MRRIVARGFAAALITVLCTGPGGPVAAAASTAPTTAITALTTLPAVPAAAPALPPGVPLRDEWDDGAAVTLTDDAAYVAVPGGAEPPQLLARSLARTGTTTAVGAAVRVGELLGLRTFAEHDGDLAYLRAGDGRLVLRSGGVTTVPDWAADAGADETTSVALSSRWVAIGPWLYDRATGERDGMRPPPGSVVQDVHLTDTRAVVTVAQFFPADHRGVYTVALGPDGPVEAPVRVARPEKDELLRAVGVTAQHVVWTVAGLTGDPADPETTSLRWARVDALAAPPAERVFGPGPTDDVRAVDVDGTRALVALSSPSGDRTQIHDVDLLGSPAAAPVLLPVGADPVAVHGSLVTFRDLSGQLWLTDHRGGTVTGPAAATPSVLDVSPRLVATSGGTTVTLTGTGLTGVTGVSVGGLPASGFTVVSPTRLEAVVPPASRGRSATVTVSTVSGAAAGPAPVRYTDLFTVQSPQRVVDQVLTAGRVTCFALGGTAAVPAGATGVALNVTAADTGGPGHLVLYPDTAGTGATSAPTASTVNYEAGADVANAAFVEVPPSGRVCGVSRGPARARVILDVTGYLLPGSGLTLQTPQRVLDTRPGVGQVGPLTGPLAPRTVHRIPVTGLAGVPVGAHSVLLNVTVTGASTPGNLRVFGAGTVPDTSVVNFAPGQDKANSTVVDVRGDGTVALWSDSPVGADRSPVHVVVDVVGYTVPIAVTGLPVLAPWPLARVLDTRPGPADGPLEGRLAAGVVHSVDVARIAGRPDGASAVVLNVTAISPSGAGNLRVYPDTDGTGRTPPPDASTLNYVVGRAVPNQVVVPLPANGRVDFYSDMAPGGTVDLAVDVSGYVMGW